MNQWHFTFVGWSLWVVLLLMAGAVFLFRRLLQPELAPQPEPVRRLLLILRCSSLALIIFLLLEPTLSKRTSSPELPAVAVLVDKSGSMVIRDKMGASNRLEVAAGLAEKKLRPALEKKSRVSLFTFDEQLSKFGSTATNATGGSTDLESSLSALGRQWAQENIGAVILLSDGRQTAGRDPSPIIKALHARGAQVATIAIGEATDPPDAVVAEVQGTGEVFLEESVNLDVKHRVVGDKEGLWELALSANGKELARHSVEPTGNWEYEHFQVPATQPGIVIYQARLERAKDGANSARIAGPSGNILREVWTGLPGNSLAELTNAPAFAKAPNITDKLNSFAAPRNWGDNYGTRIRGYIYPPQDGAYTFWISSDDLSALWLSDSADPAKKRLIASAPNFSPFGSWENFPSQKSAPIILRANRPCYIEALHKEGGGEDHVEIGWRLPNGVLERPIPGNRLRAWDDASKALAAAPRTNSTTNFEEATLENNSAEISVVVSQDPIRVYLADATPRWESRYLAAMFERDRRVQLTRRYHSILLSQPEVSFLPKTQEEWNKYDLVVLGDLDSGLFPAAQQQFAVDFIEKRGGFLVCLAGPSGMPKSFSLGAFANVLPVRPVAQTLRDTSASTLLLTPAGRDHPITQVLKDSSFNQRLWPALPPLQWMATAVAPKAGATILLEAQNPIKTPVAAIQRFGAGRVLWVGSPETWRWRDRLGDRVHQTFWLQAMRWGLAGRLRGKDARLQASLDRSLIGPGESPEFSARIITKQTPNSAPLTLKLDQLDKEGKIMLGLSRELEMKLDAADIWRQTISGLPAGHWRATLSNSAPELAGVSESRDLIVRANNGRELVELSADPAALARLAQSADGFFGSPADAEAIAIKISERLKPRVREQVRTFSLWDNYLPLLMIVALLSAEWILRKRRGLP